MTKNEIAFKYESALVLTPDNEVPPFPDLVLSFNANLMALGFTMSEKLYIACTQSSPNQIITLHEEVIAIVRKAKGDHVVHNPMYKNFPQEVMDMSLLELYRNALTHYWTLGTWMPKSEAVARAFKFENTKFQEIDCIDETEFNNIFTRLVTSRDSLSAYDKTVIEWFLTHGSSQLVIPSEIPFKETMCVVAGFMMGRGDDDVTPFVKTSTDVLRIATYLSNGDISLAENTKFRSFSRPVRRTLTKMLEQVISEEDIHRHRGKWVKLFHSLHVGDYSQKVYDIAKPFRDNKKVETFNGNVEAAIKNKNVTKAVELLVTRPGDFARRVDHLLRITDRKKGFVVDSFLSVAAKVDSRVLLQLLGNLQIRGSDNEHKIVFPKGNVQRAIRVEKFTGKLSAVIINKLKIGITKILAEKFATLPEMGNVWIDPELMHCPLPTQQRSASESLITVGRGTQLPIGDDNSTLRLFIYWKGRDIDLSATMYYANFVKCGHISYTQAKNEMIKCYHSGDITSAQYGASEFIDIDIDAAVERGIRYVAMNVLVYSGPTFAEHEECFAGWMTRSEPRANEIYDPKTVEQKVDLRSNTKNAIPVIFDLIERKAIWADLATSMNTKNGGNNVESNRASIEDTMRAIVEMNNKVSLYELFELHSIARGTIVESKDDADTVFSMYEGTTPYNISEINSEYLV